MKIWIVIISVLLSQYLYSQDTLVGEKHNWNFGLEFQSNYALNGYQIGTPYGVQFFLRRSSFEVYGGIDFYRINDSKARVFPFEGGLKYFFLSRVPWRNVYCDLNFQCSKWSGGTLYNMNYNYIPETINTIFYKSVSTIVSGSLGVKFNYAKWGAFCFSSGPGLNFYHQVPAYSGLIGNQNFYENVCKVILIVKASVKFSVVKD